MKVLSKTFRMNKDTFRPECVLTIAIPMQLTMDTNDIVAEDGFVKFYQELQTALEEYDEINNSSRI
jgi:hypothetical protein